MKNHLTSFFILTTFLLCCFINIIKGSTASPKGEPNEKNRDEEITSRADIEVPGVVGNLILMTSNHEPRDENKNHPQILPQDYIDDADVPKAVFTRKDRFYYCGPKRSSNHCTSLCYAMGYPTHTCGRISCYCTF